MVVPSSLLSLRSTGELPAVCRLLLIAGHDSDAVRVGEHLDRVRSRKYDVRRAKSLVQAISLLGSGSFDCVVLVMGLDPSSILSRYLQLSKHTVDLPVVVVTTAQRAESAKAAVHAGAADYFLLGQMDAFKLAWSLENSIAAHALSSETRDFRHELRASARDLVLCARCEAVRRQDHRGAEAETFVLPWSAHSTHHVVCMDCARQMARRSA